VDVKKFLVVLSLCLSGALLFRTQNFWPKAPVFESKPDGSMSEKELKNRKSDQPINVNKQVRRVQTLGGLPGDGPMLTWEESESGVITKTYQLTPNKTVTEVVAENSGAPVLGSPEFEALAKEDYFASVLLETNLVEVKEIFEDYLAEKPSPYFYSGIREAFVFRSKVNNLKNADLLLAAEQWRDQVTLHSIADLVERQKKLEEIKERLNQEMNRIALDLADAPEEFKQRMSRLYGEFPKSILQRLMSIEITAEPKEWGKH
jgi:hypothetical protein